MHTRFLSTMRLLSLYLSISLSKVPYDYYSLPFCKPAGGVQTAAENLGEFLSGDRIDNSPCVTRAVSAAGQQSATRASREEICPRP